MCFKLSLYFIIIIKSIENLSLTELDGFNLTEVLSDALTGLHWLLHRQ
jgi:hypothetical protein